jgi:hypothetical protein
MTILFRVGIFVLNICLRLGCWYTYRIVIPTGAKQSGGTCCFFPLLRDPKRHDRARFDAMSCEWSLAQHCPSRIHRIRRSHF